VPSSEVFFTAGDVLLEGHLSIPTSATSLVAFVHGSGSSRHSPRNQAVAAGLNDSGIATLLMDLLTAEEERNERETGDLRFDIEFLARRVLGAIEFVREHALVRDFPLGLFGASTGAAAAIVVAAERKDIQAIVSRGGRPDLAREHLPRFRAPTLLIVGGADHAVIEMNRTAMKAMRTEVSMEIVPGATHLFTEPGALEAVAALARAWFLQHLH